MPGSWPVASGSGSGTQAPAGGWTHAALGLRCAPGPHITNPATAAKVKTSLSFITSDATGNGGDVQPVRLRLLRGFYPLASERVNSKLGPDPATAREKCPGTGLRPARILGFLEGHVDSKGFPRFVPSFLYFRSSADQRCSGPRLFRCAGFRARDCLNPTSRRPQTRRSALRFVKRQLLILN